MFIEEAGFNINMKASRAWDPKGRITVVETPVTRAVLHTILGCISTQGVINVSMRISKAFPKVRKIQGGKKEKIQPATTQPKSPEVQLLSII